jgi:peptidyl-prolyl cis-trans isomerase C
MAAVIPVRAGARRAAAAAASFLFAAAAATGVLAADPSPVIAESPRAKLTLADYETEMSKLPPDAQAQFAASRIRVVQLLDKLFMNKAIADEARALGLDKDPKVQQQMERVLIQARIDRVEKEAGAAFDATPDAFAARARESYLTKQDRYRTPERIRVSHILVKVGGDGDAAAKARAEALRARLVAGEDFVALAREASDDDGSKRRGGDLGIVPVSTLDPAFAQAAVALKQRGELSPVVKSAFGYHVIRFAEYFPAGVRPFDEVKAELLTEVRRDYVDNARTQYMASIFEPKPKVDEALIDKIIRDAGASAKNIDGATKAKR